MSFEDARAADILISSLLLVAWAIAGYRAGRLPYRRTVGRLRLGAFANLAFLVAAELAVVAKLAALGPFWSFGTSFALDRTFVAGGLILVPAAAVLVWSFPRLWRIARDKVMDPAEATPADGRRVASAPALVVPVQAAALGAAVSFYVTVFRPPPAIPGTGFLVLLAVFGTGVTALFVRARRRHRSLSDPSFLPKHGLGKRLLRAGAFAAALAVGGAVWINASLWESRLPERISMAEHANVDYGGGPELTHAHSHSGDHGRVSVTELSGPRVGEPDRRFVLTAQETRLTLDSGAMVDAWTFNGQSPGPELRVRKGDLVEVILRNRDVERGVTIHWHGLDVPNAEDGVAGMTQDAVQPGGSHTYRFRAEQQAGSFWYHSHQASSEQVRRGLFGSLIVEPEEPMPDDDVNSLDLTIMAHSWETADGGSPVGRTLSGDGGTPAFGLSDALERRAVAPGTRVRTRIVNTDNLPKTFSLTGTPYRVTAIDGTDLNGPTELRNTRMMLAAGGRYDVEFVMPETPVRLVDVEEPEGGMLLSRDGIGDLKPVLDGPEFDPTRYGRFAPTRFGAGSDFDREFVQIFDGHMGFYDGRMETLMAVNRKVFPDVSMLMVSEGDLAKVTFVNRSTAHHPMHLHGHHVLVLSRNGGPATGSPLWMDTVNVAPGETWEVAFRANNPGLWMDHCHDLTHAAKGMMTHLGYEGVTTPFEVGHATRNRPE